MPNDDAAPLEKLMMGYQAGDRAAADTFVTEASVILGRFFRSRSGGPDDGDLIQDTLLRIHKARHTWRPGEPVVPWLLGVARHARADAWRKAYRTSRRESALDAAPEPPSGDSIREDAGDAARLLRHLPESQREVIIMLKVLGLSVEETARATASTSGAVKQKAHRAYETLRRVLAAGRGGGKESA